MGVFDDKKFEELDWISQATEPIDSDLNEVLAAIPDETLIDFKLYREMLGDNYTTDLTIERMVSHFIYKNANGRYLSWNERGIIHPCFQIEMSSDVIIDFETKVIHGEIKLIKTQFSLDEKVLEAFLGKEGIDGLSSIYYGKEGLSRMNEVMEILGGCEEGLRTRAYRRKNSILKSRLIKLFKNNEWKIKDTELANKVGKWIKAYVVDGNLAAWSNFCRLKVMTHKDQPIYSMEEIV